MGMDFDNFEDRGKSRHAAGVVVVEELDDDSDDDSDDLSLADIDLHLKKKLSTANKGEEKSVHGSQDSVLEPGKRRPRQSI